jgi:hypothetical protein
MLFHKTNENWLLHLHANIFKIYNLYRKWLAKQDVLDAEYWAHPAIDQTAYMNAWKKYHKTACTSLPEDEQLDVRNMSKAL